jgi:hypothetical protein
MSPGRRNILQSERVVIKLLPGNQEIRKDSLGRIEFTCAEAGG